MEDSAKPIANPLLVLREELDDWAILFDPDSGTGVGLNPVSVFIWKRLDGDHTAEEIVREVQEHFEEVPADADAHVTEFIEELVRLGFAGYEVEPA